MAEVVYGNMVSPPKAFELPLKQKFESEARKKNMERGNGRSRSNGRDSGKLEIDILAKVGEVISAVYEAQHVDQVICALHSLALLLFPIDTSLFSGTLDHQYRNQVLNVSAPTQSERNDWRHAFYHGAAFPTLARVLIFGNTTPGVCSIVSLINVFISCY
ncbi:hypothetical protein ACLOJK_008220 [Asimina triloba]